MSLNSGRKPLPNERISRNQMKERPPHILITNYAMLEYLLLRPEDNVFFHGDKSNEWKFIVLDEAHTYTGATGIEVSMLLRRLKNTLVTRENIRFILTSATLGDEKDNKEICDFASRLCTGVKFDEKCIVRAFRFSKFNSSEAKEYKIDIYYSINQLIDSGASINEINVVAFVFIARKAEKKNIMLLDARYHMFIRALEGAYVVLGTNKEL